MKIRGSYMDELTKILRNATGAIERVYFHLSVDGGDPIYRERVYCYELYHQMRLLWPSDCQFLLNGELDKSAHPILGELGVASSKPDLLVHRPGSMSHNHAIIEVKKATTPKHSIRKDLSTLDLFIRKAHYQRAIYLFFGNEADERIVPKVQSAASGFEQLAPIELWLHQEAGQPATSNITLQRTATAAQGR